MGFFNFVKKAFQKVKETIKPTTPADVISQAENVPDFQPAATQPAPGVQQPGAVQVTDRQDSHLVGGDSNTVRSARNFGGSGADAAEQHKARMAFNEQEAKRQAEEAEKARIIQMERDRISSGRAAGLRTGMATQAGGFQNVKDVLAISINPFSADRVQANIDNRVFKTAAEYVANSPYAIAAIIAGIAGIGQTSLVKEGITVTKLTAAQVASRYAVNTKTAGLTAKLIGGVLAKMQKPAYVLGAIGAMIGTYPWAEWALGEAKEGMVFNTGKALATGDPALIQEYLATAEEIYDITLWDNVQRLIPGANIAFAFKEKAKALQAQWKINNAIAQNEMIAIQNNESEGEKWDRINQQRAEQERAMVDYYNDERKKMTQWEIDARAAAKAANRTSDINARNDDAAFWAAERERQRELEAADRKAIADFWINYRKMQQKFYDEQRPSKLGFGIL